MKIKIIKALDREAQKTARADHDMPVGQIFLVRDEIGAALVAKGFAEEVRPKKELGIGSVVPAKTGGSETVVGDGVAEAIAETPAQ